MNYEQRYKEALARAKEYFKANQKIGELDENDVLSGIFPELKDVEFEQEPTSDHWQDLRERAAIAALQGTITILSNSDRNAFREIVVERYRGKEKTYPKEIVEFAMACADALIKKLKGE